MATRSKASTRPQPRTGKQDDSAPDDSRQFDGSVAEPGWNDLGRFVLQEGETQVVVTDETSGNVVIADAIRWRPSESDNPSQNLISAAK